MKLHFTTKYDFFKYNGKINSRIKSDSDAEKFVNSKNYKFSSMLANRLKLKKEMFDFLLANLLRNPGTWLDDLMWDNAIDTHLKWKKVQESLTYTFINDLNFIAQYIEEENISFTKYISKRGGSSYPDIVNHIMQKKITNETACLIQQFHPFIEALDENDFVLEDVIKIINKYWPFMHKMHDLEEEKLEKFRLIYQNKIGETVNRLTL